MVNISYSSHDPCFSKAVLLSTYFASRRFVCSPSKTTRRTDRSADFSWSFQHGQSWVVFQKLDHWEWGQIQSTCFCLKCVVPVSNHWIYMDLFLSMYLLQSWIYRWSVLPKHCRKGLSNFRTWCQVRLGDNTHQQSVRAQPLHAIAWSNYTSESKKLITNYGWGKGRKGKFRPLRLPSGWWKNFQAANEDAEHASRGRHVTQVDIAV